jgi:hypothetical protein
MLKDFFDRNLRIFVTSLSAFKLFKPSLMFVGKARAYRRDAPFHALLTNIEKLVRDKHSSLSRKFVH